MVLFSIICISCQGKPKTSEFFPKTLSQLHLIKLIQGKEAIEMVNRLHQKQIDIQKAWIAYYKSDRKEATIWISEALSTQQAKNQLNKMIEKMIGNRKGPFYDFKKINEVYTFSGLGQKHGVFCKGKFVFWISTNSEIFDNVLNYYLNKKF